MSVSQKEIAKLMDSGTAASSIGASGVKGVDPRRRRFMLNPGIYLPIVEPRESGRQQIVLPDGLVRFETATLMAENFDINVDPSEYVKQVPKDFTAEWFVANVAHKYEDRGLLEIPALTMLDDPSRDEKGRIEAKKFLESAQGYFNQIYPSFAELNHACPFGQDVCVTCRLEFLGEEDPDTVHPLIRERMDKLSNQALAEEARLQIRAACVSLQDFCVQRWQDLTGELAGRKQGRPGLPTLDDSCHHIRMHLHEHAPEDQEALTAASFGQEVAAGQSASMEKLAEAFREGNQNGSSDEVLRGIMKTQEQQGELMLAIAKKLSGDDPKK